MRPNASIIISQLSENEMLKHEKNLKFFKDGKIFADVSFFFFFCAMRLRIPFGFLEKKKKCFFKVYKDSLIPFFRKTSYLFFSFLHLYKYIIENYIKSKMQFKTIVAALASAAVVSAQNATNGTNGTNGSSSSVSTAGAASNAMGAGVFGAAVAAGVAFLF